MFLALALPNSQCPSLVVPYAPSNFLPFFPQMLPTAVRRNCTPYDGQLSALSPSFCFPPYLCFLSCPNPTPSHTCVVAFSALDELRNTNAANDSLIERLHRFPPEPSCLFARAFLS